MHHGNDESEVRINSLFDEETIVINTRVKCYPLYTLMLAVNETNIDLLSLGCQGQELEVSDTIKCMQTAWTLSCPLDNVLADLNNDLL